MILLDAVWTKPSVFYPNSDMSFDVWCVYLGLKWKSSGLHADPPQRRPAGTCLFPRAVGGYSTALGPRLSQCQCANPGRLTVRGSALAEDPAHCASIRACVCVCIQLLRLNTSPSPAHRTGGCWARLSLWAHHAQDTGQRHRHSDRRMDPGHLLLPVAGQQAALVARVHGEPRPGAWRTVQGGPWSTRDPQRRPDHPAHCESL